MTRRRQGVKALFAAFNSIPFRSCLVLWLSHSGDFQLHGRAHNLAFFF